MARKFTGVVDADDLLSVGLAAALASMDRFDIGRGVKFATFAQWRARGAMLDEQRLSDPITRSQRRKLKKAGEVFELRSIDQPNRDGDRFDYESDDPEPGVGIEQRDDFERHLAGLNRVEKRMIRMRILEEKTCKQIARSFGKSEAWASLKLINLLARIKARMIDNLKLEN